MLTKVNSELKVYIERKIIPLYYKDFRIEHINSIIKRSFEIVNKYNLVVNIDMVYVIAVFHDIGYTVNKNHCEKISSNIFRNNSEMKKYFTEKQINIISDAIIDQKNKDARNVYGRIISSAIKVLSIEKVLKNSIIFQYNKHNDITIDEIIEYSYIQLFHQYIIDKNYKIYFPDKKSIEFLNEIEKLLQDKEQFIEQELKIINSLKSINSNKKLIRTII